MQYQKSSAIFPLKRGTKPLENKPLIRVTYIFREKKSKYQVRRFYLATTTTGAKLCETGRGLRGQDGTRKPSPCPYAKPTTAYGLPGSKQRLAPMLGLRRREPVLCRADAQGQVYEEPGRMTWKAGGWRVMWLRTCLCTTSNLIMSFMSHGMCPKTSYFSFKSALNSLLSDSRVRAVLCPCRSLPPSAAGDPQEMNLHSAVMKLKNVYASNLPSNTRTSSRHHQHYVRVAAQL